MESSSFFFWEEGICLFVCLGFWWFTYFYICLYMVSVLRSEDKTFLLLCGPGNWTHEPQNHLIGVGFFKMVWCSPCCSQTLCEASCELLMICHYFPNAGFTGKCAIMPSFKSFLYLKLPDTWHISTRTWAQGLVYSRQALYYNWAISPVLYSCFLDGY